MTIVESEGAEPSISAWYYREVSKLNLAKTDCTDIYALQVGITSCYHVIPPEADWTMEIAQEHLDVLKDELQRRGGFRP